MDTSPREEFSSPARGAEFLEQPYWWSAAPVEPEGESDTLLPSRADVVIIGGGITGVVTALHLARAGEDVVVVDSRRCGEGAARRNAGFLGRTLKRSAGWLEQRHGADHACRVYRELDESLKSVAQTVEQEQIDCHHVLCGRFIGATSPAHQKVLIRELEDARRLVGFDFDVVDRHEQHREIASDSYHGGAVIPDLGAIHPGLYHAGLLQRAKAAGVSVCEFAEVSGILPEEGGKRVQTSRGDVVARHVIVTTNGYITPDLHWLARRLVPFPGFVITTELLSPELISKVLPQRRTYLDTRMNIDFIRPAPDSNRIIFGGMTGTRAPSATALVEPLRRRLIDTLPDLEGVRIDRAWTGNCAGTFDYMPHIGNRDGVHFALGYNFAGVPLGTSFGIKLAARVLGRAGGESVFDTGSFPTVPFYTGRPWFVPWVMRYFDWKDRRLGRG